MKGGGDWPRRRVVRRVGRWSVPRKEIALLPANARIDPRGAILGAVDDALPAMACRTRQARFRQ
jgi:hypothetical protein